MCVCTRMHVRTCVCVCAFVHTYTYIKWMANSLVGKRTDKYQKILGNEAINSRQITQ